MTEVKGTTWDFAGRQLDPKSALAVCYAQGFRGGEHVITAAAVMTAESQRWTKAYHHNHEHNPDGSNMHDNETGGVIVLSTDRGLFQINDKAQGVGEEIFDARLNVRTAYEIYRARGNQFTAWAAFNSGAYLRFVDEIRAAYEKQTWRLRVPKWTG